MVAIEGQVQRLPSVLESVCLRPIFKPSVYRERYRERKSEQLSILTFPSQVAMLGPSSILASLVLCLISLRLAQADFVIFEPGLLVNTSTPVAAGEVSQQCISALESTIACDPYLRTSVLGDSISYLAPSILDGFCTSSCGQSLSNYHQSVQSACGGGPELWQGTPATLYGDQVWAQYNITCFKDSKGQYCQSMSYRRCPLK